MALTHASLELPILIGVSLLCFVHCRFENVGITYTVTLNIYSGREDPEWTIDFKHPMYSRLAWALNNGPPTAMRPCLGYTGFTVEARNFFGQIAYKTIRRQSNRPLETLLLESCKNISILSPSSFNHVHSSISEPQQTKRTLISTSKSEDDGVITITRKVVSDRKKRQALFCSTVFEPEKWNYQPVQRRNNCYNYATNRQTNTFAQPGRASGQRYTEITASNVYAAALRDGLTRLSVPDAGNECLIALVIWEYEDYHFLRLDSNGFWSQKSGRTLARNTDNSETVITDPRFADRGPYTVFAGWLGVGPNVQVN